jgi:hypothetical protein
MLWDNICGGRALRTAAGIAALGEDDGGGAGCVSAHVGAEA